MSTMTRPDLDGAELRLAALVEEAETLAERTVAARRAGDADGWMTLVNRADDLPGELLSARVATLHLRAVHWSKVAAERHVDEVRCKVDAEKAALAFMVAASEPLPTHVGLRADEESRRAAADMVLRTGVLSELSVISAAAATAHRHAVDATCAALLEIDLIERELIEVTSDEPGDGFPSPAGVLNATVTASSTNFGELFNRFPVPVGYVAAGTRPPRWIAHRLSPELFHVKALRLEVRPTDAELLASQPFVHPLSRERKLLRRAGLSADLGTTTTGAAK